MYEEAQILPLTDMYGKNLVFKTVGVDGCECRKVLDLIAQGRIDITPLITHGFGFAEIDKSYDLFENRQDHMINMANKN